MYLFFLLRLFSFNQILIVYVWIVYYFFKISWYFKKQNLLNYTIFNSSHLFFSSLKEYFYKDQNTFPQWYNNWLYKISEKKIPRFFRILKYI